MDTQGTLPNTLEDIIVTTLRFIEYEKLKNTQQHPYHAEAKQLTIQRYIHIVLLYKANMHFIKVNTTWVRHMNQASKSI